MTTERRHEFRKSTEFEVMISKGSAFRMCNVQDISRHGAFLDIGWSVLTSDTAVELAIDIPPDNPVKTYKLPAKVSRVTTSGTAIRFEKLSLDARVALSHFIEN